METVSHTHFLDPAAVIAAAGIAPGETVADFGCAAGYFSLPCAAAVGDDGTVIAIDILPSALEAVESKARVMGRHIETRRANIEKLGGSGLEDASVDWVILKNVLFMSAHREGMLAEAFRVVRDGGHALVVEWNDVQHGIGPQESDRISPEVMRDLLTQAGFGAVEEVHAGDYHYGMIARKN